MTNNEKVKIKQVPMTYKETKVLYYMLKMGNVTKEALEDYVPHISYTLKTLEKKGYIEKNLFCLLIHDDENKECNIKIYSLTDKGKDFAMAYSRKFDCWVDGFSIDVIKK